MTIKRDISLGMILLTGLGLTGAKASAQLAGFDKDISCPVSIPTIKVPADERHGTLQGDCSEYRAFMPAIVHSSKNIIAVVHMPPLQTWKPTVEISFPKTIHFLVKGEKQCATMFSLADKGNGAPADYICENRADHKPYAELQCDGDRQRQNCYGLRFENGRMEPAVLSIKASLQ